MICSKQLDSLVEIIGKEPLLGYINDFEQEGLQIIGENTHLNYLEDSAEIWQLLHKLIGTAQTLGLLEFCELAEDIQKNPDTYREKLEELKSVLKKNVNEGTIFLQDK